MSTSGTASGLDLREDAIESARRLWAEAPSSGDVCLVCIPKAAADDEGNPPSIRAHSAILAMHSPVLRETLLHAAPQNIAEQTDDGARPIHVQMTARVAAVFVELLYTHRVEAGALDQAALRDGSLLEDLIACADFYCVGWLRAALVRTQAAVTVIAPEKALRVVAAHLASVCAQPAGSAADLAATAADDRLLTHASALRCDDDWITGLIRDGWSDNPRLVFLALSLPRSSAVDEALLLRLAAKYAMTTADPPARFAELQSRFIHDADLAWPAIVELLVDPDCSRALLPELARVARTMAAKETAESDCLPGPSRRARFLAPAEGSPAMRLTAAQWREIRALLPPLDFHEDYQRRWSTQDRVDYHRGTHALLHVHRLVCGTALLAYQHVFYEGGNVIQKTRLDARDFIAAVRPDGRHTAVHRAADEWKTDSRVPCGNCLYETGGTLALYTTSFGLPKRSSYLFTWVPLNPYSFGTWSNGAPAVAWTRHCVADVGDETADERLWHAGLDAGWLAAAESHPVAD